mmetsp:Transcript_15302/g.50265  ORF Transcript_15302/g.50265 Transcript_15302/m.50265 type:complete len:224 (+) Transcript_15302:346-1017(+)
MTLRASCLRTTTVRRTCCWTGGTRCRRQLRRRGCAGVLSRRTTSCGSGCRSSTPRLCRRGRGRSRRAPRAGASSFSSVRRGLRRRRASAASFSTQRLRSGSSPPRVRTTSIGRRWLRTNRDGTRCARRLSSSSTSRSSSSPLGSSPADSPSLIIVLARSAKAIVASTTGTAMTGTAGYGVSSRAYCRPSSCSSGRHLSFPSACSTSSWRRTASCRSRASIRRW